MKFIDLSVVVNEETPVYPGDPPIKIQPAGVFAKDGYNDHLVSIGTHVGTHMDAPLHMIDGGKTLDQISPSFRVQSRSLWFMEILIIIFSL